MGNDVDDVAVAGLYRTGLSDDISLLAVVDTIDHSTSTRTSTSMHACKARRTLYRPHPQYSVKLGPFSFTHGLANSLAARLKSLGHLLRPF
jgi:hypothetical protein